MAANRMRTVLLSALFTMFWYMPVNASKNIIWTPSGQLAQGDTLKTIDSKIISVLSVKKKTGTQPMYNLTVNHAHNYFIANVVLVHNICIKKIQKISDDLPEPIKSELSFIKHELYRDRDSYSVTSKYTGPGKDRTIFRTIFSKNEWWLVASYRDPNRLFHANDVLREQWLFLHTKEPDISLEIPRKIIHRVVMNENTISKLKDIPSNTKFFLRTFKLTVLGKQTNRIGSDFGFNIAGAMWGDGNDIVLNITPDRSRCCIL